MILQHVFESSVGHKRLTKGFDAPFKVECLLSGPDSLTPMSDSVLHVELNVEKDYDVRSLVRRRSSLRYEITTKGARQQDQKGSLSHNT